MTSIRRITTRLGAARRATAESTLVFVRDVGHGLLEVSHNTLAGVGFVGVALVLFASSRAEIRHQAEVWAFSWLQARHGVPAAPAMPPQALAAPSVSAAPVSAALSTVARADGLEAVARATASDPSRLSRSQLAVAQWLARRYRVAPEPISRLVLEAWHVGERAGLDPTLILAIMAVESSFNPFAQSAVGAQGLMQVMTRVHDDKYTAFGGKHAAFDPVTNLRVGVQVLKECIARAGSLEAGLRFYVGAANVEDGGYAGKVLSEQSSLRQVAGGKAVPVRSPQITVVAAPVAEPAKAPPAAAEPAPAPGKADEEHPPPEQVALVH